MIKKWIDCLMPKTFPLGLFLGLLEVQMVALVKDFVIGAMQTCSYVLFGYIDYCVLYILSLDIAVEL